MDEAEGGDVLVCGKDAEEVFLFAGRDGDVGGGGGGGWWVDVEKVEEGVGGVGVMPAVGLERELAVHEDDGVAVFEKVFGGSCTAGSL